MLARTRCVFRIFAIVALTAVATVGSAQVVQPKTDPKGIPTTKVDPKTDPKTKVDAKTDIKTDTKTDTKAKTETKAHAPLHLPPHLQAHSAGQPAVNMFPVRPVIVMPSLNTLPGIPASDLFPAAFTQQYGNPALDNPWMNQTTYTPVPANPFAANPFTMNPFFNNPFALNPLLPNAALNNPFGIPGFTQPYGPTFGPGSSPFGVTSTYTPPVAVQQPGQLMYKGPDLQVNPTTGTIFRPLSGIVKLADGSVFYYVPGSGTPTVSGTLSNGSGLYYNPQGGTFFNPSSGVISKPAQTHVYVPQTNNPFLPYMW
jgi:hypothetical protein